MLQYNIILKSIFNGLDADATPQTDRRDHQIRRSFCIYKEHMIYTINLEHFSVMTKNSENQFQPTNEDVVGTKFH
jgi:hypothetical protein